MADKSTKSPDIARFGAALPPGAAEVYADAAAARYRVEARLQDLQAFYEAIYGKTKGITVERQEEPAPPTIAVAVGPACKDAAFGLLLVRSAGERDKPRAHEIWVLSRDASAGGDYPDSSPWVTRRPR